MKRAMTLIVASLATSGLVLTISPPEMRLVSAVTDEAPSPVDENDVAEFMAMFDVDREQAALQLDFQQRVGTLGVLRADASFAGMVVDHSGGFDLRVFLTAEPSSEILAEMESQGLSSFTTFHLVPYSMDELKRIQRAVNESADDPISSAVDPVENAVRVDYINLSTPTRIQNDLGAAESQALRFNRVSALGSPSLIPSGGRAMTPCTSGFTVVKISTGNRGISTAGHCGDSVTLLGKSLTFKDQLYGGENDFQWMDSSEFTWTNTVEDGISGGSTPFYRHITSREATSSIVRGNFYCKTGKTTGFDCGTVSFTNFCPSYGGLSCDFFLLASASDDMSSDGDSGGPVYVNEKAVGTISGEYFGGPGPDQAIVGPQATFANLDLRVAIS